MLLEIKTDLVRFRVAGTARRKQVKGQDAQTRDGRPVWVVRLIAIEDNRRSSETIWVEVAGEEPVLAVDELVSIDGLVYAPWVNRKGDIVRSFRARAITAAEPAALRKSA